MSEEIRNEEFEEVTTVETDDEKAGLGPVEYGVVLGIAGAGIAAWELGKLGWRKTAKPRAKVKDFFKGIFKKDKVIVVQEQPDHEGSAEKTAEDSEPKRSDKKSSKK